MKKGSIYKFETEDDRVHGHRITPIEFEFPIRDVLTLRMLVRVLPDLLALWWSPGNFVVGRCARLRNGWEHCETKMRAFGEVYVRPIEKDFFGERGASPQDRCAVCGRYPHEHYLRENPAAWELYSVDYHHKQKLVIRPNPELRVRTGSNRLTKIGDT